MAKKTKAAKTGAIQLNYKYTPGQMFAKAVRWIGHNTNDNSNKVWGYLVVPETKEEIIFWGRVGGPYRFKRPGSYAGNPGASPYNLSHEKMAGGYVDANVLALVIHEGLYESFVAATLLNVFHGEIS